MTATHGDPTFYPSPRLAMEAPFEDRIFVTVDGHGRHNDSIRSISVHPDSPDSTLERARIEVPGRNDFRHLSWNSGSSSLCPYCPNPRAERRYLLATASNTSRIVVVDTQDASMLRVADTLESAELSKRAGLRRPGAIQFVPSGIVVAGEGQYSRSTSYVELDPDTLTIAAHRLTARRSIVHGFAHHIGHDAFVEAGSPMPRLSSSASNSAAVINVLSTRDWEVVASLSPGGGEFLTGAPRGAHNPTRAWGVFATFNPSTERSSVWRWFKDQNLADEDWKLEKLLEVEIPPMPHTGGFTSLFRRRKKKVRDISDIVLSIDDTSLFLCSQSTREILWYDIRDHHSPRLIGTMSMILSDAVGRLGTPARPERMMGSLDGRRIYVISGPDHGGSRRSSRRIGWLARVNLGSPGEMELDRQLQVSFGEQTPLCATLAGGDTSSEVFCFS